MEDLIAAAVFITALAALFVLAVLTVKPFLPSKTVEVPAAPGKDAPTIRVYVYNDSGRLYAVEYAGSDPEAFRRAVGVPRLPRCGLHGLPRRLQLHQVHTRSSEDRAGSLHWFVVPAAV
jgi:hypothetical protein